MLRLVIYIAFLSTIFVPLISASVPLTEFYPFGLENGDEAAPATDDGAIPITLAQSFPFFSTKYDELFVNLNGAVSFLKGIESHTPECGPLDTPMIAPFWADINTAIAGSIFYRESTELPLIVKATADVLKAFPNFIALDLNWLFITTWLNVPFYGSNEGSCNGVNLRNTFQSVITSDGTHAFAIFYYNNITWTTGSSSGGNCSGQGGEPAKGGFDLGDGLTFHEIPASCTPDMIDLEVRSNVNEAGKWVFRVDDEFYSSTARAELVLYNKREPEDSTYVAVTSLGSINQYCIPSDIKATRVCLNSGIWLFYTEPNFLGTRENATVYETGSEGPRVCHDLPPSLDKRVGSYRPAGDDRGSRCTLNMYISKHYAGTEISTNISMSTVPFAFNSIIKTGPCDWQFYMKERYQGFTECLKRGEDFVPDFFERFGVLPGDIKSIQDKCDKDECVKCPK